MGLRTPARAIGAALLSALWLGACNPRVTVEPPKEPITINLNVKIEHEIRVKVDKQLDSLFDEKEDIF